MSKTVTIPLEEFDKLRNGFEESRLKKQLEERVKDLEGKLEVKKSELKNVLSSDFVEVERGFTYRSFFGSKYYFRQDKTPIWIKTIFNKI
jgi:hypothetical protein